MMSVGRSSQGQHLTPLSMPTRPQCGMCLESPTRPLTCNHSFCLDCFQQILLQSPPRSASLTCPTCKSPASLLQHGVQSLKTGFNWTGHTGGHSSSPCQGCTGGEEPARTRQVKGGGMPPERLCPFHPDKPLRFYCTRCSIPICWYCTRTSHHDHQVIDLKYQSDKAKNVISVVLQKTHTDLEPTLQQILQEAETHQESIVEAKKEMAKTMRQRAEVLKAEIDQALSKRLEELDSEAAEADKQVSTSIDNMTQGLVALISFREYAYKTAADGCHADVVDLLPKMKAFFAESMQKGTEGFEILEKETPFLSRQASSLDQDGVLRSFLDDKWKTSLDLSDSSSMRECPFCSFTFSLQRSLTCPKCCTSGGSSSKTPKPTNLLRGLRGRGSSNSSSSQQPQRRCQTCSQTYDMTFHFCPSCGTSPSQESLIALKTLIPQYIGHVSRKHPSSVQEENTGRQSPSSSRAGSPKHGGSSSPRSVSPQLSAGSQAWEVYDTVSIIGNMLDNCK